MKDAGIYPAGENRWRITISKGRDADGKYRQVVRIAHGTIRDARKARATLMAELESGRHRDPAKESLDAYLRSWLGSIRPPHGSVKVSTYRSYESHVRVHLQPDPIAELRLDRVCAEDVAALYRRLLDKGLSPATVSGVRRTLRCALNDCRRLDRNPVLDAKPPRVAPRMIDPDDLWSKDDAKRFLAFAGEADPDMAVLARLALDSGARLGELLALQWRDVAVTRAITISKSVSLKRLNPDDPKQRVDTPKSDKSRVIDISAPTYDALLAMQRRQQAEPVADLNGYVFRRATTSGFAMWRHDSTTHRFQKLSVRAGVRPVPIHWLRHCCASWLLAAGMDVVAVSARLGHWAPSLTLEVYSHAVPGRQQVLAQAIGDALS